MPFPGEAPNTILFVDILLSLLRHISPVSYPVKRCPSYVFFPVQEAARYYELETKNMVMPASTVSE